jgi:hypothetical protein
MTNIYNLFKFIESKEPEYKTPSSLSLKAQYAPNEITKEDLYIEGDFMADSPITYPDDLTVTGNLRFANILITLLPNNLTVGDDLNVNNTKISSLPKNLKVGGNFIIYNTPLAEKYTEKEIRKMAPGVKGRIYTTHKDYKKDYGTDYERFLRSNNLRHEDIIEL